MLPSDAPLVPQFLHSLAAAYGEDEALVLGDSVLTYAGLERRSRLVAQGLLGRGVGKGTRIGLLHGNSPEWVTWWAAIARIGATVVPLSTFARAGELARTIRHADLHALVTAPCHLGRSFTVELETALPGLATSGQNIALDEAPFLRWVLLDSPTAVPWANGPAWLAARAVPERLLGAAEEEVDPADPVLIIYTSGTSAAPKGVVHSQGAVMAKTHYLRSMLGFRRGEELVANLPFFWVGGLVMSLFTGLEAGARVVCQDASTYRLAAPLGSSSGQHNPYAGMRLLPAIGMTETFGMYSWGSEHRVPGFPIASPLDEFEPGYEVDVVGADGCPVEDGRIGEIIVRGPTVTRQLVKVPRSDTFTVDGYLRTGDRGQRDGGRIHFVGRLGDMIKTSGANVAPPEVEQELLTVDGVLAAYVVGIDSESRGQDVAAAVVLAAGKTVDPDSIRATLRKRLSGYKVPRHIAILLDSELPLTAGQKVDRRALAALIESRNDAMSSAVPAKKFA